MKIGAICSSGGSALFSSFDILEACGLVSKSNLIVITDRACNAEKTCLDREIRYKRVSEPDNEKFSEISSEIFSDEKCDLILLYFTRVITSVIFNRVPTINFHPSILPAFKGIGAIDSARKANAKFLGATMHCVSHQADSGEIIGQVITPMPSSMSLVQAKKESYIQKVYLSVCAVDLISNGYFEIKANKESIIWDKDCRVTASCCPALVTKECIDAFSQFQSLNRCETLIP